MNQEMFAPIHFLSAVVTAEYAFVANFQPLRIYAETGFREQLSVLRWIYRA